MVQTQSGETKVTVFRSCVTGKMPGKDKGLGKNSTKLVDHVVHTRYWRKIEEKGANDPE